MRRRREFRCRVEWTNWTVGPWWGWIGRTHYIALDLGPAQLAWTRTGGRPAPLRRRLACLVSHDWRPQLRALRFEPDVPHVYVCRRCGARTGGHP